MRKIHFFKLLIVITILFPTYLYAITLDIPLNKQGVRKGDLKKNFEEVLKIGLHSFYSQKYDTAIGYFNHIYQKHQQTNLTNEEKLYCAKAANCIGASCAKMQDYFTAMTMYWKAIDICNEIGEKDYPLFVFNNIAILYGRFSVNDQAFPIFNELFEYLYKKQKYEDASELMHNILLYAKGLQDTAKIQWCMNFSMRPEFKNISSAQHCHSIASSFYHKYHHQADSTIFFVKKAIGQVKGRMDADERLMDCYQYIGEAFFEMKKYDSAIFYLNISNLKAQKLNSKVVLKSNYKTLISIYQILRNKNEVEKLSEKYICIADSAFEEQEYLCIKQLEYSIERNKKEGEIIQLQKEKTHNEVIISVQKKVIISIATVSLIILSLLFMIYLQKKQLVHNSHILYLKNKELTDNETINNQKRAELQALINEQEKEIEQLSMHASIEIKRYDNSNLSLKQKQLLTNEMRNIFENSEQFLSPDFSLEKLAKKLKSNTTYVSQIINGEFGKNFTSLINELRIKRACKYLEDTANKNYTLEFIAQKVGFNNRTSFITSFKKYVGITPSEYLKISSKS